MGQFSVEIYALPGSLLSGNQQRLNIVWKLDHDLQLTWGETRRDGLSEDGDVGSGFGTLLVQTSSRQLGGHVEREIRDDMFTISLTLPDKVLADA